jgi:hypothetical protein
LREDLTEILFTDGGRLSLRIPDAVARRYHLTDGVEMEIVPTEEGIMLRPLGVEPWFSIEWEQALEDVLEYYGPVLERIGE